MQENLDDIYDDILDESSEEVTIDPNVDTSLLGVDDTDEQDDDYDAQIIQDPLLNNSHEEEEGSDDEEEENDDATEIKPMSESKVINDLLKAKGIQDPKAIQYEDENGEITPTNFYDLTYEEQLEILKSSDSDIDFGLDEQELGAVNFLRQHNVTFEEAVEYYKRQAVEEYIKEQNSGDFTVDNYTDEELFALDLKAKYDELTDEELAVELEKESNHPELFKKKVDKIRAEYKQLEIEEKDNAEKAKIDEENQKFETLKDNLIEVATITEDIGGLELDIDEKNEILTYSLQKDVNGKTALDKALADPKTLFQLAWYAVKGKDAFEFVHDYYKKEIEKTRKTSFEKGKEQAVKASSSTIKKTAVVNPAKSQSQNKRTNVRSIDDLFD